MLGKLLRLIGFASREKKPEQLTEREKELVRAASRRVLERVEVVLRDGLRMAWNAGYSMGGAPNASEFGVDAVKDHAVATVEANFWRRMSDPD